jgi:hypothetical protein
MDENELKAVKIVGGLAVLGVVLYRFGPGIAATLGFPIANPGTTPRDKVLSKITSSVPVAFVSASDPIPLPPLPKNSTSSPYTAATRPTVLPPGTRTEVAEAVAAAEANGTLTEQQQEAVEQLYAPMYYPDPAKFEPAPGYTVADYNLDGAVGGGNPDAPPGLSVVDFGSVEAAEAALAAYMDNFV